ncbi:SGNH/GDSL hydrolase family protein [Streptomyces sp. A7024]|uniref:SGNH/GDSL hydrolase family protein n=1 Tax=Streptomyces coryli TaxID=1128680 RepID=A0A6G4U6I2_9ACTN|nr:SGNH/GDSL hydrolase family protein [Streptomyces coryli]NGN66998.1 SGNH/GDSL hydrolase family protein [Streptomyces coryli]
MPSPTRTRSRVVAVAAALAATAALGAPAAQAASAAADDDLDYVALGDSYSAGSAVLPLDPTAPLPCLRSLLNYPHVIAKKTGADLKDVTCGGATTEHFTAAQYPGVAPQVNALSADTDLVTLTIGGNDNNTFVGAILACATAGLGSGGKGSPCKDANGSKFTDDVLNKTAPAVKAAVAKVKEKAPNARIAVLGYPWILPAEKGCFPTLPVAEGDVPYLRDLQTHLNTAVEKAASGSGATFVDFAESSEGHDACQAYGTRWIDPVLSTSPVHPNAYGESRMADETMKALGL